MPARRPSWFTMALRFQRKLRPGPMPMQGRALGGLLASLSLTGHVVEKLFDQQEMFGSGCACNVGPTIRPYRDPRVPNPYKGWQRASGGLFFFFALSDCPGGARPRRIRQAIAPRAQ